MESRLKIVAMIAGLTFGFSGCAELNHAKPGNATAQPTGFALATPPDASQSIPTQLIAPNDKQAVAAMNEALPNIGKVLGIHQCVKDDESLRLMNIYAVPGVNMANIQMYYPFPNSSMWLKNHDLNKCVRVSTLDQWTMSALNALQFRAVYFADDSGETVNFQYSFKKVDDGSWKLFKFSRTN